MPVVSRGASTLTVIVLFKAIFPVPSTGDVEVTLNDAVVNEKLFGNERESLLFECNPEESVTAYVMLAPSPFDGTKENVGESFCNNNVPEIDGTIENAPRTVPVSTLSVKVIVILDVSAMLPLPSEGELVEI
jgi:hypothetical protein